MRFVFILPIIVVVASLRYWLWRRRRSRSVESDQRVRPLSRAAHWLLAATHLSGSGGPVGLVAAREIRERLKGRVFRIATLVVLLAVAAAVVIPAVNKSHKAHLLVGVVGSLSVPLQTTIVATGPAIGAKVSVIDETTTAHANTDLRNGRVALAVIDGRRLRVNGPLAANDTSATALLARSVSVSLGLEEGIEAAGIPSSEAARLANPLPLPVSSIQPPRHNATAKTADLYGVILTYVLLTQYGTWLLMGVVEEKSSRVIEVLLSTLRPRQLLTGKVIGIGAVALMQSALIVATALGLGAAVGSDLLHGSAPLDVLASLLWLVLGYAFYCWVYAAGGSLAERQSQVQSLAFPLQLPLLFGYIVSLTAIGSGQPSELVKVLAWLPPTAPFAMPALLALGRATWWEFTLSALIMVAGIALIARFATFIYYRAILRTGGRVSLRQIFAESAA